MFAQLTFKGKVIDEKGAPIEGASVWLEYTTVGTYTDKNGLFVLEKVPEGRYTLRATSIDYEGSRKEINSSDDNILFTLKKSFFKLNEVVVTGTNTHHTLKNTPIQIDVLSKRELQNISSPSFIDAMTALSPSLTFTPNAMGSNLQLNGLSNKYVLILVDGKRLAGDVSGNIDLSRINMYNIKRIEILKGAASSLYGSEAIGGVINIITDKHKETLFISSDTRYAGHGQFSQAINADINYKWFSSSTSYQRNQADGWQLNPQKIEKEELVDTYKNAMNTFYSDVLTQQFTINPGKSLSMYLEGSLFDRKLKRSPKEDTYDMKYEDYSIGAGMKYRLKNKGVINLDMYTDNFEYYKVYTQDGKSYQIGDEERQRRQKYYDVNLKGTFDAGKYNRITAGTQYQVNYLDSKADIADGSRDVYTLSFYLQDEIRLFDKRLQLIPGIRYVYNETFKNRLTPKLSLMYSLDQFNFRASYAAGYKAPDIKYLFSNTESKASGGKMTLALANKDLKPETSDYFSLNAEYINSFITFSVSAYINNVKDLIALRDVEPFPSEYEGEFDNVKQYVNSSKAKIKGIDINMHSDLGYGLSLGLGYSFIDSKDYDTRKPLEKISKHTGTINANWNKKWWVFDSNINFNGRLQTKRYYSKEDGRNFNLWNLTTRHRLKNFNGFILEPGFGIENIFDFVDDRPYGVNYATLSPGRTFYASLSIRFSK